MLIISNQVLQANQLVSQKLPQVFLPTSGLVVPFPCAGYEGASGSGSGSATGHSPRRTLDLL